jgi:D-arginine dehydrogenase
METDVLVIGAGMAGASTAAELAGLGRRVVLLERESQPGMHATGRSAALFSETYGGPAVRALTRASRDFYLSPPEGFTESSLVKLRPAMHVADAEGLATLNAFASSPDVAAVIRPLDTAEALRRCPILRAEHAVGVVLEFGSQDIEVHGLHQAYLRKLRAHGGQLKTEAMPHALTRRGALWRAETTDGAFEAPVVVNAAGAWAGEVAKLAGASMFDIEPRRRTAVLVDAPPNVNVAEWPFVIDAAELFYFKPDAGRLLLSPADETPSPPCDAQPDEMDIAIAIDRVETATTLQVRHVRHRWAGLRTFVHDRTPVIGFDPKAEGFFWVAALGGYGIQTAPGVGKLASTLIATGRLSSELEDHGVALGDMAVERLLV